MSAGDSTCLEPNLRLFSVTRLPPLLLLAGPRNLPVELLLLVEGVHTFSISTSSSPQ